MIITKDELKRRLQSGKNILNNIPASPVRVVPLQRVNNNGEKTTGPSRQPSITGNVAGAVAAITGHVEESARTFGISTAQVRAARNSRVAQEARERVSELALSRLMLALGLLEPEKLATEKLDDISKIAIRMAGIVEKMTPAKTESSVNNGVQVLLYMPEQRNTDSYKIVDV